MDDKYIIEDEFVVTSNRTSELTIQCRFDRTDGKIPFQDFFTLNGTSVERDNTSGDDLVASKFNKNDSITWYQGKKLYTTWKRPGI